MGNRRIAGAWLQRCYSLGKPGLGRDKRRGAIGRAGEEKNAVLRVVSAAARGIVMVAAARLITPAMKTDRIEHGETDSHPGKQQDGEKTKKSGRQSKPVPH